MVDDLVEIFEPQVTNRLSNADILLGKSIEPIKHLQIISEYDFEDLVREWACGFLTNKYEKVRRCGGAGDMGRDVVAFAKYCKDESVIWDNYQCKHYNKEYPASEAILEIGKLVYYTFLNKFTVPRKYYFVCPLGVSTALSDLIDKPDELKQRLITEWDKKCRSKITKHKKVELKDDLAEYVDRFNFEIFDDIDPQELIEQHSKTRYYFYRFGGMIPSRPPSTTPPIDISENETLYVKKLIEAYSDQHKITIRKDELSNYSETLEHFKRQRKYFYEAESLMQFERDILPPGVNAFDDLKEEVYDGIIDEVYSKHENGFERIKAVTQIARSLRIYSNPLLSSLKGNDLHGICHHLANDNRIEWVKNT